MINSSKYKPRIFPINGDIDDAEIDRAQSIDPTVSLNREKVEEIGRDGVVGYMQKSPTVGYRLTQLENGSIEFLQKIINNDAVGDASEDPIDIDDFKESYFDICAYLTDDDGTFRGTMWYPALRTAGFGISIGDPQAMIERSFDFVGEQAVIWQGTNKYLIYGSEDIGTATETTISLAARPAVVDPDNAGVYMLRVVRVRSGVSTELTLTTDYTCDATTLTIVDPDAGDVIKYWYTSATAPVTQFTNNDTDPAALLGDCASIYLYIPASGVPTSSDYIYRLQSVGIDVSFDREDLREIGNKNVVQRGIKNSTVSITLGRIIEQYTVEEVLRGVAADYGKIDVEKLSDDLSLIIKIFTDNTKDTFAYGIRCDNLSPTDWKGGATVNEYVKADATLEGEELYITKDATELGI